MNWKKTTYGVQKIFDRIYKFLFHRVKYFNVIYTHSSQTKISKSR